MNYLRLRQNIEQCFFKEDSWSLLRKSAITYIIEGECMYWYANRDDLVINAVSVEVAYFLFIIFLFIIAVINIVINLHANRCEFRLE